MKKIIVSTLLGLISCAHGSTIIHAVIPKDANYFCGSFESLKDKKTFPHNHYQEIQGIIVKINDKKYDVAILTARMDLISYDKISDVAVFKLSIDQNFVLSKNEEFSLNPEPLKKEAGQVNFESTHDSYITVSGKFNHLATIDPEAISHLDRNGQFNLNVYDKNELSISVNQDIPISIVLD